MTTIVERAGPGQQDIAGRLGIWGDGPGVVADALMRALPGAVRTASWAEAATCDVVTAVGSAYADEAIRRANQEVHRYGPLLLSVQVELGKIAVGPLVVSGEPGCYLCARIRAHDAREAGSERDRVLWANLRESAATVDGTAACGTRQAGLGAAAHMVGGLVGDEIAALRAGQSLRCRDAVLVVDTETLATRRHLFLPVPECLVCGSLPDDTPDRAVITLRQPAERLTTAGSPASPARRHQALLSRYVDDRLGLIARVGTDLGGPAVTAGAPVSRTGRHTSYGWGRMPGRASAEALAILEALERFGGLSPQGKRTVVHAAFADLGPERAVDPVSLGLPDVPPLVDSEDYTSAVHDTEVGWVYGYSFRRQQPVLVPQSYAYYGVRDDPRFAYECSNGCALGGTIEQAILHGLLEVAERDAFLMTWYARLPVPRLDPRSVDDPTTRLIIDAVEDETGMRLHVFDTTTTEGIPSLWLAFVDEDGHDDWPKAYFGAAANLDPERALRSAVLECSVGATRSRRTHHDADRLARAREMLTDPDRVLEMEHHAQLYALPEAWSRLDFLYQRDEIHTFAEAFSAATRRRAPRDPADELREALDRYLAVGLDVIVVDQTAPEHRVADLHCVKVIVPGMLPMTFGHRFRRAANLPRLRTAPVRLGYRDLPLTEDDINPHPHPFP
jgi:ribosomal protein S12 methylthiotransferase accessory factor